MEKMEKIKVGEWYRDEYGNIGQIHTIDVYVNKNPEIVLNGCIKYKDWKQINKELKHSKNIIDLIKVRRLCK